MLIKNLLPLISFSLAAVHLPVSAQTTTNPLSDKQQLGKRLFFDPRLSTPAGQSCAGCHAPAKGFTDPRPTHPVSEGGHRGRFTSRNAPTVMYLATVPGLHRDEKEGVYIGGLFYDGRANSLEEQIEGPLFNANEMGNVDKAGLVRRLKQLGYMPAFTKVFAEQALSDTDTGLAQLKEAIAAYERSAELNPFTSKYDYYLQGKVKLSAREQRGLKLFEDEKKGNCAACHPSAPRSDGSPPLFTDFSYDNLGVPANPANPFLKQDKRFNPAGEGFIDLGLGRTVKQRAENGKFKVPTLRNVELSAPYMHNGVFATLEDVVDFYNRRDVDPKWGKPEVAENLNNTELGDLGLSHQEVTDLVAFMRTLTDGFVPD